VKAERENGRLQSCTLLFPNIEPRLNTGAVKGHFVNIHLLVCPDDPNHISELNRFLGQLVFSAFSDKFVCTPADLIRLGKRSDSNITDDQAALRQGCTQFKVSRLREKLSDYQGAKARVGVLVTEREQGMVLSPARRLDASF
jgi:hypothetical protein